MCVNLVLECRAVWRYQEGNQIHAYIVGEDNIRRDVAQYLVHLWNAYWDAIDQDRNEYHSWMGLRIGMDQYGGYIICNAAESFTLDDFAANLEGIISLPIVCIDGEESPMRGKERVV